MCWIITALVRFKVNMFFIDDFFIFIDGKKSET